MFELPFRAVEIRDQVESFFNDRILPNHKLWLEQAAAGEAVNFSPYIIGSGASHVSNFLNLAVYRGLESRTIRGCARRRKHSHTGAHALAARVGASNRIDSTL